LVLAAGLQVKAAGADGHRFFYEGDGRITLVGEKSKQRFSGSYRLSPGHYDDAAYKAICRVMGAPSNSQGSVLSLRLIAFLDFLEDRLSPGSPITIISGYRTPRYNTTLRDKGGLAAKASLHQYGMAVDIKMAGVGSKRIWQYVKALGFGGAGYYHGETVHVDVGPARSWDETTSGVGTGISDDNKLIGLVTDFDRYGPQARVTLRFIRMTAFPIGVVPEFVLARTDGQGGPTKVMGFHPDFAVSADPLCPQLGDIDQLASIQWRLPAHLSSGRYTIVARFCDVPWEKMPGQVTTSEFEIGSPE
jgi:uncharacterized protein YcbK (DUF882 family)